MSKPTLHREDTDWLKQVNDWIHAERSRQHIKITEPIEQPHIHPWSTVLRIPASEGTLFFKAAAQETKYEAGIDSKI